ncbi:MAG: sugar phosphate isomerase/epimerase [Thermoprotei archaeon]|nr:sugar phosphate isomerase/epimerase [Thermoprotei archaeon]
MFVAVRDVPVVAVYGDILSALRDLELNSFELCVDRDLSTPIGFSLSSSDGISALRRFLESNEISICAILAKNDFSRPSLSGEVKYLLKVVKIAEALDVHIIRINPPMREVPGYTIRDYISLTVSGVLEVLRASKDVHLAIENHGVIGNNLNYVRNLLKEITDQRFGVTLDTGNYYWYGYPVSIIYEIYEELAPRVKHTHIKDATTERKLELRRPREVRMTPIGKGDLDFNRILDILHKAGYDGDLTLEDESISPRDKESCKRVFKEDIVLLKGLLRRFS